MNDGCHTKFEEKEENIKILLTQYVFLEGQQFLVWKVSTLQKICKMNLPIGGIIVLLEK